MKYTIIIIILVFSVSLFLLACKSKKPIIKTNSQLANPIIALYKSNCFGKCKVYNLKIYKDRTVIYEGIKNVEKIGIFNSVITDVEYQSLINLFEGANFQNLEPTYLTGVRDKQKITLEYFQKEVQYQNRAASEELKLITKKIEIIAAKIKWIKN